MRNVQKGWQNELTTSRFFETEPHERQRWEGRFLRKKHLYNWQPSFEVVTLAQYPDNETAVKNHNAEPTWENTSGRRTSLDGNTRKYGWMNHADKLSYEVPNTLQALIYFVKDYTEADAIYNTIDQTSASKKTPDEVTSAFRRCGLIDNRGKTSFKTDTFQSAKGFPTIIKQLSKITPTLKVLTGRGNSSKLPPALMESFVREYKYTLLVLDDLFDRCRRKKSQALPTYQKAVCLMFLRKYGSDNGRVREGIKNLISGTKMAHSDGEPIDGITYILENWNNGIYESNHAKLEKGSCMDQLTYFFQSWMDDKFRVKFSPKRNVNGQPKWFLDFFDDIQIGDV